jgi:hypothetical protein
VIGFILMSVPFSGLDADMPGFALRREDTPPADCDCHRHHAAVRRIDPGPKVTSATNQRIGMALLAQYGPGLEPDKVPCVIFHDPSSGRTLRARFRGWHVPTRPASRDATMVGVEHHERMVRALRAASGEGRHDTTGA